MNFQEQFRAARRVSVPIVVVRTFDAASATQQIRSVLGTQADSIPLLAWDVVQGYYALNKAGETTGLINPSSVIPVNALIALKALCELPDQHINAIVMFHHAHLIWNENGSPKADVIQAIWNVRDVCVSSGNMLVLFTSPGAIVPAELQDSVLVIDEPLPTREELSNIVLEEYTSAKCTAPDKTVVERAVHALIGLPVFPAKQSVALSLNNKTGELRLAEVWEKKRQIVSQTPGCTIESGNESMNDVRGLDSIVTFLHDRMHGKNPPTALLFQDEVEKMFAGTGTDMSGVKTELTGSYCTWFESERAEGITCIGVAGTSKSALAKALANEYEIPLISFNVAAMQSGIIGSSGENLRAAQKMVSAISEKRLLVISTCNGWEQVPPEIRRRIGSLGVFFFDVPSDEHKPAIWALYREKYNIPADYKTPVDTGWTGAEIKECCRRADVFNQTLEKSATYTVPITRSSGEFIKNLRTESSGKFLSASYPGVYTYTETNEPTVKTPTGRKFRNDVN